jgi:hypothetical protein
MEIEIIIKEGDLLDNLTIIMKENLDMKRDKTQMIVVKTKEEIMVSKTIEVAIEIEEAIEVDLEEVIEEDIEVVTEEAIEVIEEEIETIIIINNKDKENLKDITNKMVETKGLGKKMTIHLIITIKSLNKI